ncbi:MAG TPA: 50S ribosomal protein L5 [Candidatus Moranbacteria bacterium]|nr:50S ribosomal protein L5 [Candidatus Moranbacteria bacterium]
MKIVNSKIKYNKTVVPSLEKEFGYKNALAVPKVKKVIVNVGIGKLEKEKEKIKDIVEAISNITGQKPLMTKARKSISGFKVREGSSVGVKVTLRGKRMWDFIDRLNNVAFPRTRDFQGIKISSVSTEGDLNIGIKEQIVFPEISAEEVRNIFGLQINVVTTANNKKEGEMLFRLLGFPLEENNKSK